MNYSIIIFPQAQRDFLEIQDWYMEQSFAAASRFTEIFDRTMSKIAEAPHRFSPLRNVDGRKAKLKNYPYHIYFYINEAWKRIEIVAVIHTARHPRVWKRRF